MTLKSQADRILTRLQQGPATTWDIGPALGILCPTRRVFELRQLGNIITKSEQRLSGKRVCTYTLEGHSGAESAPPASEENNHKPDKTFQGASTKGLLGPGVYGWRRGEQYLYIGMSKKLFRRLGSHDVVGRREELQARDSLDFWFCESINEAAKLEAILIEKYAPMHNGTRPPVDAQAQRLCAFNDTPGKEPRTASIACLPERERIVVRCSYCGQSAERKSKARPLQNGELPFCTDSHRAKYHRQIRLKELHQ